MSVPQKPLLPHIAPHLFPSRTTVRKPKMHPKGSSDSSESKVRAPTDEVDALKAKVIALEATANVTKDLNAKTQAQVIGLVRLLSTIVTMDKYGSPPLPTQGPSWRIRGSWRWRNTSSVFSNHVFRAILLQSYTHR
ncbi:hypothetical protein C8R46DRAFT_1347863 [Mycena filopes]|nr:hypothetical protein C8R46DRAFT_1347863 [Mycena filopes]